MVGSKNRGGGFRNACRAERLTHPLPKQGSRGAGLYPAIMVSSLGSTLARLASCFGFLQVLLRGVAKMEAHIVVVGEAGARVRCTTDEQLAFFQALLSLQELVALARLDDMQLVRPDIAGVVA